MAFGYTNRKGRTYYLHARSTRRGGVRYVFAKTIGQGALDEIPEGFEVVESAANAQVSLRKVQVHRITDEEFSLACRWVARVNAGMYRAERRENTIIVLEPASGHLAMLTEHLSTRLKNASGRQTTLPSARHANYRPVMRFVLDEETSRTFSVERMTYRGEGGWSWTLQTGTLKELLSKYLPHLGRDSFFDLV